MLCPKCECVKVCCIETRNDGQVTYRRYRCPNCNERLYTREEIIPSYDASLELSKIETKRYGKNRRRGDDVHDQSQIC